jgi:leucyl/phenylalanyl-tRNA--protein transferase
MADEAGTISWYSPDPRGVMPLDTFHVPSRLQRTLRRSGLQVRIDAAFNDVMHACAEAEREGEDGGTWISDEIIASYTALHTLGYAHSVEVRDGDRLVGGLYGVALGGAFFGESMFHTATDASKIALVALIERLRARGFTLLDTPVGDAAPGAVRRGRDSQAGLPAAARGEPGSGGLFRLNGKREKAEGKTRNASALAGRL